MANNGDIIELVGFEDVGEDGEMYSTMKKRHHEKTHGTHILQFMFLGVYGFRFPFAHFFPVICKPMTLTGSSGRQ